jgi:MFS family permease
MRRFAIRDHHRLFSDQVIALFGTGLTTVALGLLAYDLAGPHGGLVLGTALTIKMVMYVVIAPPAAAYVDRFPRRTLLVLLDVVRGAVVLALPLATEVWHIYVLIGLLQTASAAFTPTFRAVIPGIVTDESAYTRALSASQVASTTGSLLSPVLAAAALAFLSFDRLFLGASAGFPAARTCVPVPGGRAVPRHGDLRGSGGPAVEAGAAGGFPGRVAAHGLGRERGRPAREGRRHGPEPPGWHVALAGRLPSPCLSRAAC